MLPRSLTSLLRQPRRLALLGLGLFMLTSSVVLIGSASQSTVVEVEQALSQYWRTTYDILVRPAGSRSAIEEKYGLVEANYLSGLAGGISMAQYEVIQSIPGIEVAAPIAILTHLTSFPNSSPLSFALFPPDEAGVYLLESTIVVDDGVGLREIGSGGYYTYIGPDAPPGEEGMGVLGPGLGVGSVISTPGGVELRLLLAAIDPPQEAILVGLDQAVIQGQYLTGEERFSVSSEVMSNGSPELTARGIPILINATPYGRLLQTSSVKRVLLPPDVSTPDEILAHGGAEYLDTLPGELVEERIFDSDAIYGALVDSMFNPDGYYLHAMKRETIDYRAYYEILPPTLYEGLVLDVFAGYANEKSDSTETPVAFTLSGKGVFDIEEIPRPEDVNRVPLETYFPPLAILRYDLAGQPVEPAVVRPVAVNNPVFRGWRVLSPPMLLTTMEAAQALCGEDCISAIRVRVSDIDVLTPAAQRKIETIASDIVQRTGLDVDIMVGSSPTHVLVHAPEIGYVEEQWVQKNVNLSYKEKVQSGHLLLLGTLLGIGSLFALDLAWAEVVARRRTIALQKALGWRSATVFRQVLGQIVIVGTVAAVLGSLIAWGISGLLRWEQPATRLLLGVPLLVVALAAVGGLYPAWLATGVPPVIGLRAGIRHQRLRLFRVLESQKVWSQQRGGLLRYAWQGLARRWSRTALGGLTATLSAALLVLMLAVTVDREGAMSGTLLGEFILVHVEGYHYTIVGIGFGLATLSLANSLLAGVLERRREIGVFKAVGWRTSAVARLFLMEGALLGLLGGFLGTFLGLGTFVGLYETVSPSLAWIGAAGLGLPVGVGLLAALYPARVAANVPPAEAVRYA